MNGSVARKLRQEVYPKDFSKRDTGYAKNSIRGLFAFFNSKGEDEIKRNVRFGQAVCTGFRNKYKQAKKNYMLSKKEGWKYKFILNESYYGSC